jgi:hypothetical protein
MFDEPTTAAARLCPGPDWFNTFDPAAAKEPPRHIEAARASAHLQARAYMLWGDEVLIVLSPHRHLATGLTRTDVVMPRPPPGAHTAPAPPPVGQGSLEGLA